MCSNTTKVKPVAATSNHKDKKKDLNWRDAEQRQEDKSLLKL